MRDRLLAGKESSRHTSASFVSDATRNCLQVVTAESQRTSCGMETMTCVDKKSCMPLDVFLPSPTSATELKVQGTRGQLPSPTPKRRQGSPPGVGRHPKPSERTHSVIVATSSVLHETPRAIITQVMVLFFQHGPSPTSTASDRFELVRVALNPFRSAMTLAFLGGVA